jgi:methylmalonyl-CoA mutase N-terminal domain/subunit
VVVGVNRFESSDSEAVEIMKISPRHQAAQARALARLRAARPQGLLERHRAVIERAARGTDNLLPPLKAALADYITIGECCNVLRGVFGEYQPSQVT